MSDWGKVIYNKNRGHYAVIGKWQGKRVYLSQYQSQLGAVTCKTEQQAEQLRMVCNAHIDQRIFNPARFKCRKPMHIKAYALSWLEMVKSNISYATYKSYRACIKHHIIPGIGDTFLPDLNYEKILNWINETNRSVKTKKNIHGVLAKMLRDAEKSGHIGQLPSLVSFTGGLSVPVSDPEWIDFETQSRILGEIQPEHRYIFRFLFITGVRPSEARALRKKDVFRNRGYILIRKTFAPVPGGEALKEVKQKRERRIPFYHSLDEFWDDIPANLTEFVFINLITGKPYSKNINRDVWNPASKRALGYVFPLNNAGRHSFGNQLSMSGVDMETIRDGLGHSTTSVTRKHYANPSLENLKKAVDNVRKIKIIVRKENEK